MGLDLNGNKLYSTSIGPKGEVLKQISTDGLVFHVDAANKNSYSGSSTWSDLSGNNNNGTLYNSPTFGSDDAIGNLSFNGSNQYMQANVSTTSLDGDPNFTVEMFVKRTATLVGTAGAYWGLGQGGTQGWAVQGWTPTDNRIHMDLWDSSRVDSQQDYPLNTWVHIVWSKIGTGISPSTVNCFINGAAASCVSGRGQTSGPAYPTSTNGNGIAIGRIAGNYNGYYGQMKMGVFRVYNRGLSLNEAKQNFYAQKSRFGL